MAESLAIKMTVLNRFRQRSHLMPGRIARVRYSLHPRQSSGSAPMLVRVQNLVLGHSSGYRVPVCPRLCWLRLCIPIIPSDTYVSKWRLTGRNGTNMWTVTYRVLKVYTYHFQPVPRHYMFGQEVWTVHDQTKLFKTYLARFMISSVYELDLRGFNYMTKVFLQEGC